MTDDLMTTKDVAAEMHLNHTTISGYTSGKRKPRLKVAVYKQVKGEGKLQAHIRRSDFEAWKAEYSKKKPFGAQLHKVRRTE